ncbi:ferritin-like domain-containing protein [Nannocystis punicea]|uniref:Ferritin-like domain-containing protein n=1 Tax=Nannocystis punicea TaxID=2995304 RepID=A0ABY7H033_9BACT|nr:ferritin-like domain-containing protein [Nannocystis poenicansa]WAS92607.1 ferritin-like domain-containing protein [Nannocystis poenicansa]
MLISRRPHVRLSAIATAVLALEAAGCGIGSKCPDNDPETGAFQGVVKGPDLANARKDGNTDAERCEAACRVVADEELDEIVTCEVIGPADDPDHPWAEGVEELTVTCTATFTPHQFCTGRRPQGHHEADIVVQSRPAWFAVHAHLERAAVTAFRELAEWLAVRGAPASLVARCREAAADEVRHADALEALARRDGAEVPPARADPPADDLFAVACHNAVEGCVSEAFAAIVAAHQAGHARSLELRALFSRLAADELRHGQLAWDLHAWLWDQLTSAQQTALAELQARALADLPVSSRRAAAATPRELGWPGPDHAARMAELFAGRLRAAAGLAA